MHRLLTAAVLAVFAIPAAAGDAPAVGVWDPRASVHAARITVDAGQLDRIAAWIGEAGLPTVRLDTAALERHPDPAQVPVLFMPGDTVPRSAIAALQDYAAAGGVLVGLAGRVPFNDAIAPGGGAAWALSPAEPRFAWETRELREALGLRYVYNPVLHDQGVLHQPSALLQRYLPGIAAVRRKLPHAWICPRPDGGRMVALIASSRADGDAVVPAIYIATRGRSRAIICSQPEWAGLRPAPWWDRPRELVQALARIALDLAAGRLDPAAEAAVALAEDTPAPEPFRSRPTSPGVDPDGAEPVLRMGRFDGSSLDLGGPVPAGQRVAVPAGGPLPRCLMPGSSLVIAVDTAPAAPAWLRLRLAFDGDDAAIAASLGGRVLLSEQFTYHDAGGASNNSVAAAQQPSEINRIVCLPPGAAGELVLANPGRGPVWFDAIQIEGRPHGSPPLLIGFNAAMGMTQPGGANAVQPGGGRAWGALRQTLRLQNLGEPGDPARWERIDRLVAQAEAAGAPVHAILEGCPAWMATPASLAEAIARKRPHICVPRLDAWTTMLEELVPRYRGRIAAWELWNEVDIRQFWIGTPEEYVALWQATQPVIARLDPGRPLFSGGLAAQNEEMIDAFVAGGVTASATWIANHCYAGQSPMWEMINGRFESLLYARGVATPIHANEQGFVSANAEWFTGPPPWTRERQARALDIALARLLAAGHVRASIFTCGGDAHPYGCLDAAGGETAAYRVAMDYMALNGPGASREDVSLTPADGGVLRGVYAAAARLGDGRQVVLLNPAESPLAAPPVRLALHLPDARPRRVSATCAGNDVVVTASQDGAWLECRLALPGRCIVRIEP